MSEIKKEKPKKEKKKLSRSAIVLIAGIVIIAIPVLIFVGILAKSALETGTPREGSRFDGDLDPAITEELVGQLKNDLSQLGTFDNLEVICKEGQLRIYIDTADNLTGEQIDTLLNNAYNKVNTRLPISTYFTATGNKKMYDLQINIYTTAEASEIGATNSREYKILHKNSFEETYEIDDVAHPKDPALAAELEGITVETETGTEETPSEETTTNE